jgi:hypothetical protein
VTFLDSTFILEVLSMIYQ